MESKYQGWSPERIQREIDYNNLIIKEMERIKNRYAAGTRESDQWMVEISQMKEKNEILENLLKPKIDYEDGTWV